MFAAAENNNPYRANMCLSGKHESAGDGEDGHRKDKLERADLEESGFPLLHLFIFHLSLSGC